MKTIVCFLLRGCVGRGRVKDAIGMPDAGHRRQVWPETKVAQGQGRFLFSVDTSASIPEEGNLKIIIVAKYQNNPRPPTPHPALPNDIATGIFFVPVLFSFYTHRKYYDDIRIFLFVKKFASRLFLAIPCNFQWYECYFFKFKYLFIELWYCTIRFYLRLK